MGLNEIFTSFGLALGQIPDRRFFIVIVKSALITLGGLLCLALGLSSLFGGLVQGVDIFPFFFSTEEIGWWVGLGSFLLLTWLSVFIILPTIAFVSGFFLETVAAAVEERHYPQIMAQYRLSFGETLKDGINLLGLIIVVNILAFGISLILLPFSVLIFLAANGWLLGREYMQLIAQRHMTPQNARKFRKHHSGKIWIAGMFAAVSLGVPIVNLFVPVLAIAMFTHLFHRLSTKATSD